MLYEIFPKVITFYDYSGIEVDQVFNSKDLDYQFLKYDIAFIYLRNGVSVVKAEIKVVTYIDLLTKVAGVPSFLFLVYKFCLKHFEKFYSDIKIC